MATSSRAAKSAPGGARAERAAATRERILETAIDLIAQQGYAATTVAQICRGSGVAAPSVYWHFDNKEGLLAAVVERVGNDWVRDLETEILIEPSDGDQLMRGARQLERAIAGWRARVEDEPKYLRVMLAVALECGEAQPEIREVMMRFGRRAIEAVVRGIQDAVQLELRDLDLVAQTVISMIQGALLRSIIDPEGTDLGVLFDELARTLVLVIANRIAEAQAAGS